MDPITIGALAVAAGSAAYKMYKDSQGSDKPAAAPRVVAPQSNPMDRLRQYDSMSPSGALNAAAPQPAPLVPSTLQQPVAQMPPASAGAPSNLDPLERLRRLQQPGF